MTRTRKIAAFAGTLLAWLATPTLAQAQEEPVPGWAQGRLKVVMESGYPGAYVPVRYTDFMPDGSQTSGVWEVDSNGQMTVGVLSGKSVYFEASGQIAANDGAWYGEDCANPAPTFARASFTARGDGRDEFTLVMPRIVPELTEPAMNAEELRFIELLNAERAALGRPPLVPHERLAAIADAQATNIDRAGAVSHFGANCEPPEVRAAELGYITTNGVLPEVALTGPCDQPAHSALARWKGSPGHWLALTDRRYRHIGVARVGSAWVGVLDDEGQTLGPLPPRSRTSPSRLCDSGRPSAEDDGIVLTLPGKARVGQRVRLSGFAPAGASVEVRYRPQAGGAWKTLTARADQYGEFTTQQITVPGNLLIEAHASGQSDRATLRAYADLRVRARKRGRMILLTGKVKPALRQKLIIRASRRGGKRTSRVRLARSGKLSMRLRAPAGRGRITIRLSLPGKAKHYRTTTKTLRLGG